MIVTPLRVPRGGSLGQPAATPRAMATLRSISVTVLLALSALVFPSHAMAQEGNLVTITGTVLDAVTNQPIQGVIVELSGQGFRFETDGRGEFTLFRIPTGNYRLELSHPDYTPPSATSPSCARGSSRPRWNPWWREGPTTLPGW